MSNVLYHDNYEFILPEKYILVDEKYITKGTQSYIYKILDVNDNQYYILKLFR